MNNIVEEREGELTACLITQPSGRAIKPITGMTAASDDAKGNGKWIIFMSLDVEVSLNTQYVASLEVCGDTVEVRFKDGGQASYSHVCAVQFKDAPSLEYPELIQSISV